MKSHVRVAVIGGGVVGCSVLYHLAKLGWSDVVLLERDELTCGSTWHAAGGMHTLNSDPNVAKLQEYTIQLYKEIEEISGQSCGAHITGGLMMAGTPERMDFIRSAHAQGKNLGMQTELVSVEEAAKLFPLMEPKHFLGALYDPMEGHVDPSGVTNAYAKAARIKGAEIHRKTRVMELNPTPEGHWQVVTDQGTLEAEIVVNAGGLWAREVGRMVGLELPILAMQHQYIITEEMPEVLAHKESAGQELMHVIDFEAEIYMRQERGGMLMGTYERQGVPWSERETPWDFGHELLPPDLDRIAESLAVGFAHFPAFERAGIKNVINGPFTFAPDGNPLIGPVRGLKNFYVACGVMAGFSQGGGVGLALANWIAEGDPGMDVWAMDVARFGDWATLAYTNAKVRENYSRRFRITFPNEELPAARPLRTTPVYDRLKARNAVFGAAYGLEHALWFAPEGMAPVEEVTYYRSNAHEPVGRECHAVREGVGLLEISNFAKYEVAGPEAESWLSGLLANRMPRDGKLLLTPMLNPRGRLIGDFTLGKLAEERFYIFGSGIAEEYHLRWFESQLPAQGVSLRSLRRELVGLQIAGPKARELLSRVTAEDVSNQALPFLSFRRIDLGMLPVLLGRISFTGELGYELWVAPEYQLALYDLLVEAGEDLGLTHFGGRALHSLRLEKGFGAWTREYTPDYDPIGAGMGRFTDFRKNAFVGRDAAMKIRDDGPARKLCLFTVEAEDADAVSDEPIFRDGKWAGFVTSGGYGHSVGQSLALGYVESGAVEPGSGYAIEILGHKRPATLLAEPPVDPKGERLRS